jgi:hypothetical protein
MPKAESSCPVLQDMFFKNGVVNAGIKLYNRLPNQIGKLEKIQQFKRKLRFFLLHNTFYSVAGYMSY